MRSATWRCQGWGQEPGRGWGGREKGVKVPGAWVTPGRAGQRLSGTEETDRRHHTDRQMAEARDRQMGWRGHGPWPWARPHAMRPALALADTQSLGRGGRQPACPDPLLGPSDSILGADRGPGSHMQLGAQVLSSQRPGPWATPAQHSLQPRADATAQHTGSPPQPDTPPCLPGWAGSQPCFWLLVPPSLRAWGSGITPPAPP